MINRDNALYLGHLGPIPLYVHWTFLFLVWMVMPSNGLGNAEGLTFFLTYLSILLAAIVLHELGHGLAAKAQGELGITITLWAFGGVCSSTRSGRPWKELIIVLAGPLVSAILALSCHVAWQYISDAYPAWLVDAGGNHLSLLGLSLLLGKHVNLMLLIFNMLPIFPLDGGQAVHNLMLMFLKRSLANSISMTVAVVGSIAYVFWRLQTTGRMDFFLVVMLAFMLWNAHIYLRNR